MHQNESHTHAVQVDIGVADALRDALVECVTNINRHAGVRVAELAVTTTADDLLIVVGDAGRGFDSSTVADDRLGLRASIAERMDDVGGSSNVWSRPGFGTSAVLRVPTHAGQEDSA